MSQLFVQLAWVWPLNAPLHNFALAPFLHFVFVRFDGCLVTRQKRFTAIKTVFLRNQSAHLFTASTVAVTNLDALANLLVHLLAVELLQR